MARPSLEGICPFFIVRGVDRTIAFYRDHLGFEVTYQEPEADPFFAIIRRGGAQIFLKGSGAPLPNPERYSWARWDAYVQAPDPDALAAEFASNGAPFSIPLKDNTRRPARLRDQGPRRLRLVLRPAKIAAAGSGRRWLRA